jgi:hypothetical protein
MLQHNLPPLRNVDTIRALSAAESTRYCEGYALNAGGSILGRKQDVAGHIGCTLTI